MEAQGEQPQPGTGQQAGGDDNAAHPARELSLHLLRMFETRVDAAGIVVQAESQRLISRLQLQILAGVAILMGLWGGIVLLAIALPENLRVPVLSAVVAAFFLTAAAAWIIASRKVAGREAGTLAWFLESLKMDVEVLARSLQSQQQPAPPPEQQRNPPNDIAA